ncbi:MAG: NAD-dependent epimerase/dehydratase family protein [Verrucomicrobia bacterium]|nr:NAD-dependent epimerase/dehydratase family protein [Verrucomicrobiota bacterium]
MKVLVTGGGGFLGLYVVKKLLAKGYEVRVLGRTRQPKLKEIGIDVVQGDIRDAKIVRAAARGVEVIQHIAAKAGVWGSWDEYYQINVVGTRNVLNACKELGIKRLVYTSTPSVVFNRHAFRGVNESQPYGQNWLCHYAHTKMIAEKDVLSANDPDGSGLRTIALRPHLIWGVGDNHLIPRVIDRARKGKLRVVGDGKNKVDIVHVKNAADAQIRAQVALEREEGCGRPYFISQGEPVVLWDWINDLLERLGIPKVEKHISLPAAYRIGAVMEGVWKTFRLSGEPPMTRFVATEMAKDHYFDISAARQNLGYQPAVSTEQGLEELVRALRG